ncbi:hypothetical protein A2635_05280 [Candidatus Peribacteria bacterium RIFCSPHIGHO2_01_FULL_51_9]|nr:MAG: hypothetical protein A2635_05280 [Candidatus Peribacteria bacterium RIFCSPHIGHO2_01_FULL_51_9]
MKYKTIYADPPWMEVGGGKIVRGAQKHYPLMKTEAICDLALPLSEFLEPNAHLYLWVTNNFLIDGLKVMRAWGFEYKTTITWMKTQIGLGQYFRGVTEHCLFGVRGVLPYKIEDGKRQQGRTGFTASKEEHSRKPKEMREMIERVSYPPFLELFARKKTVGWDAWGDEILNDIILG